MPIELLIEKKQKEYYVTVEKCDRAGKSTLFIEFMLAIIKETLTQYIGEVKQTIITTEDRIKNAHSVFGAKPFSRKDYLLIFKTISTATASRDLKEAVIQKLVKKSGDKNNTTYQFI